MNFFIETAVNIAARWLAGISSSQWDNVKAKVIEYEDKVLPNEEKHKEVAEFIHNLVHTSSITIIDFLIKMALLFTRKYVK